ncbi:hypothetical protein [Bdellovibrio sp.]|uniref:hypothetical protein n=1 Tax=Bdellovibrio sp. TaxID=28201 RepID=UPI0032218017
MKEEKASTSLKTFVSILLVLGTSSWAWARKPASATTPAAKQTPAESIEESLISGNIAISEWFDGVAEGLDLFLAGRQYTSKKNPTSATISSAFYYNEKNHYSDATSFNLNLRLPNVEEYWMITFTSYDETKERGVSQTYLRQTPREQDYGATLGFFQKLGDVRTSFQPHISFAGSFKISNSLTFESVAERGKNYRVNPKLQFYADADKGTGIFQAFNFNFLLTKIFTLTFINEGDYEDRTHLYTVTNGVALGQWFNKTANISYNFFVISENKPSYRMTGFSLSTSWSQTLYKNMLSYQLIPGLGFNADDKYRGIPGMTLILDLQF